MGSVRVDNGLLSLSLHARARGCKLSSRIIKLAVSTYTTALTAEIKVDNEASIKAFGAAGFTIKSQNSEKITMTNEKR